MSAPISPYGILIVFTGTQGSYLVMYNLSTRSYIIVSYYNSSTAPYLSPGGPYLCVAGNVGQEGPHRLYLQVVLPNGSLRTVNLANGDYICEGLAVQGDSFVASLENVTSLLLFGQSPDELLFGTITQGRANVTKVITLPSGVEVIDFEPGPRGMLYGVEVKYIFTPISNVYALYPAFINIGSESLSVLNDFNQTLSLPYYEYLVVDSSLVADSMLIRGGVFTTYPSSPPVSLSVRPVLVYFNLTTYVMINASPALPQGTTVTGDFWSPWGIFVSVAQETMQMGAGGLITGANYSSPQTFLAVWEGPVVNVTNLLGGRLVINYLYVGGRYYLLAIRPGSSQVYILQITETSTPEVDEGVAVAVALMAAASIYIVLRARRQSRR